MGNSAVFDEYLINLHTDPHTLQTDSMSASWATNGHRAAEINTTRHSCLREEEMEGERDGEWWCW